MRLPSAVVDTVGRYRSLDMEYPALRVVGRGLFLAVILMVAFLYVFASVTDVISGTNEVQIPTTSMGLWRLALRRWRASRSEVEHPALTGLIEDQTTTGHIDAGD